MRGEVGATLGTAMDRLRLHVPHEDAPHPLCCPPLGHRQEHRRVDGSLTRKMQDRADEGLSSVSYHLNFHFNSPLHRLRHRRDAARRLAPPLLLGAGAGRGAGAGASSSPHAQPTALSHGRRDRQLPRRPLGDSARRLAALSRRIQGGRADHLPVQGGHVRLVRGYLWLWPRTNVPDNRQETNLWKCHHSQGQAGQRHEALATGYVE